MSSDVQLALVVTVAAVVGSIGGAALAKRVPAQMLRKVFAGFVLVMAGYVVWREAGLVPAAGVLLASGSLLLGARLRAGRQMQPTASAQVAKNAQA